MGETRNAHNIFIGKPEGKKSLERRRSRWKGNNKMETYNKCHIVICLSDAFAVQNGLNYGGVLSLLLLNFTLECFIRKVQES
jgi:hypothetical protein